MRKQKAGARWRVSYKHYPAVAEKLAGFSGGTLEPPGAFFATRSMEANMPAETSQPETATHSPHSLIASDRVEGTPVRRSNGEKIGSIERLMIDKVSGNVAYAVLSFGGFLGMGYKHAPIPWARLTYDTSLSAYRVELSNEELRNAPSTGAGEEFDWGDRSRELEIHNYYRVPPYWGAY
jgi:PRC-barrel domain